MTHSSRALENREERQVPHLNSHNKYNWRNNATDDVYCKLRIWFEGQAGIIDLAVDTETDLQVTVLFQFWYIVMMVILDVHWQWWVTKNCSIYFFQASSVLFCQWVGEQEYRLSLSIELVQVSLSKEEEDQLWFVCTLKDPSKWPSKIKETKNQLSTNLNLCKCHQTRAFYLLHILTFIHHHRLWSCIPVSSAAEVKGVNLVESRFADLGGCQAVYLSYTLIPHESYIFLFVVFSRVPALHRV